MKNLALVVAVLSLAVGCGDDSQPVGGGGNGGNGGSDGGNGGNGGADGGNGGDGGGTDCQQYIDAQGPPVQTVTVTIRNTTENPIYLGETQKTCGSNPPYRAETLAGAPVKTGLQPCELTCSELAQGGCACAADCALPSVTVVFPGGTFETSWTAVVYENEAMPAECYADASCVAAACVSPVSPSAALEFFSDGYPELANCTEAICDCDGGLEGSCTVTGATLVSGTPAVASAEWDNSSDAIVIVF